MWLGYSYSWEATEALAVAQWGLNTASVPGLAKSCCAPRWVGKGSPTCSSLIGLEYGHVLFWFRLGLREAEPLFLLLQGRLSPESPDVGMGLQQGGTSFVHAPGRAGPRGKARSTASALPVPRGSVEIPAKEEAGRCGEGCGVGRGDRPGRCRPWGRERGARGGQQAPLLGKHGRTDGPWRASRQHRHCASRFASRLHLWSGAPGPVSGGAAG